MFFLKALAATFSCLLFIVQAAAADSLNARVSTQDSGLRCREMGASGEIGNDVAVLPKGSVVQIDTQYLISQLAMSQNKEHSMDFLRQRACSIFGNAWKNVSASKVVEGERHNYLKIKHQNLNCFASLQYLEGINFSCDELRSSLTESLDAIHPCGKQCLMAKQEGVGLAKAWSSVLGAYGAQEQNANTKEGARFLRERIDSLCSAPAQSAPEDFSPVEADRERQPANANFNHYLAQSPEPFQCSSLSHPKKLVSPPQTFDLDNLPEAGQSKLSGRDLAVAKLQTYALENHASSLFTLYRNNLKTACDNLPSADWKPCYNGFMSHFEAARNCFGLKLPRKQNRHILSSFLRDPQLRKTLFIPLLAGKSSNLISQCSKDSLGRPQKLEKQYVCAQENLTFEDKKIFQKRVELWDRFNIVALAQGLEVEGYDGKEAIASLSLSGLDRILKGYQELKNSLEVKLGEADAYSHVWGGGGFLARTEDLTVNGQFGQVFDRSPLVMHMVIDPATGGRSGGKSSSPKSSQTIAERVAHENFHAQDFIDGKASLGTLSWSESSPGRDPARKIFHYCQDHIPTHGTYGDNFFKKCQRHKPSLFNFRNGGYQAENVYEFYASMANVWIRNAKSRSNHRSYACQNQQTERLWREMETQLLGRPVTTCD